MTNTRSTARILDQFYTSPTVARDCIDFAKAQLSQLNFDTLLEPSAGAGAFSDQLGPACLALDIDPRKPGIVQADFLKWAPPAEPGRTLVIGNPPFGRAARTAVRFFNKAAGFADVIAFIVPLSFRKDSVQRQLDRRFHLLAERELPMQSFIFEGARYSVPCCFQIWERRPEPRLPRPKATTHADFTFCKREEADFALQRVGANAGRIKFVDKAGSANSHYFLRATGDATLLRLRFEKIDFDTVRNHCAGCPSISKAEVVDLYCQILADEEALPHDPLLLQARSRRPVETKTAAAAVPLCPGNLRGHPDLARHVGPLDIARTSDALWPLPIDTENVLKPAAASGNRTGKNARSIARKADHDWQIRNGPGGLDAVGSNGHRQSGSARADKRAA